MTTRGVIVFPGGSPPAALVQGTKVSAAGSSAAVAPDGSFTLDIPSQGQTTVFLVDDSGRQLMIGYAEATRAATITLTPLSTAAGLLFYALGAFTMPMGLHGHAINVLAADSNTQTLATVLAAQLAQDPLAIVHGNQRLFTALQQAHDAILATAGRSASGASSASGRPSGGIAAPRSGRAPGQVAAITTWKREPDLPTISEEGIFLLQTNDLPVLGMFNWVPRATRFFIYQSGYSDDGGVTIQATTPVKITDGLLAAASKGWGAGGGAANLAKVTDFLTGKIRIDNVINVPSGTTVVGVITGAASPAMPLLAGQNATIYTIELVGPGDTVGTVDTTFPFYSDWQAAAGLMPWMSFALDVFLPALILEANPNSVIDQTIGSANLLAAYTDLAQIVQAALPSGTRLASTNLKRNLAAALNALATDQSFRQALESWVTKWASGNSGHGAQRFNATLETVYGASGPGGSVPIAVLQRTTNFVDVGGVMDAWAKDNVYLQLGATVQRPNINVSASPTSSGANVTAGIEAGVPTAVSFALQYAWRASSGTISPATTTTSPGSPGSNVTYSGPHAGSITVTVTVAGSGDMVGTGTFTF